MLISYPVDAPWVLRKKVALLKQLRSKPALPEKRIAILGGSSIGDIRDMLEIFLLDIGIRPHFYEALYGNYYAEAVFDNPALQAFSPDIIYLHTTSHNLLPAPILQDTPEALLLKRQAQEIHFTAIWDSLATRYRCTLIQNTVELPALRPLGNLDASHSAGIVSWINELNIWLKQQACNRTSLLLHDLNYLAADFGLGRWHDMPMWCEYKYAIHPEAMVSLAHSLAAGIGGLFGKSKKCIILDADNTLWGGVIGDEDVENIRIGEGDAEAEAYKNFQWYLKKLKERGIVLAICSKNDPSSISEGLNHPSSLLHEEDFAIIVANWNPKPDNVQIITGALNIAVDDIVFVDDNPAERALMQQTLPEMAVPDIGSDPAQFSRRLDRCRFFELPALSENDIARNRQYQENISRAEQVKKFTDYNAFLASLEMRAKITPFSEAALQRVSQLINKTNQFNLTTRRLTLQEVTEISLDPRYITLCGTLTDRFGDNGLITALIARQESASLHIDVWVMSCRVFNRQMEWAMYDALLAASQLRGIKEIIGYYLPTAKNALVKDLYKKLGFTLKEEARDAGHIYSLSLNKPYHSGNLFITVNAP